MFEEVEDKKTPAEKKLLAVQIIVAIVAVAVIGVVVASFVSTRGGC